MENRRQLERFEKLKERRGLERAITAYVEEIVDESEYTYDGLIEELNNVIEVGNFIGAFLGDVPDLPCPMDVGVFKMKNGCFIENLNPIKDIELNLLEPPSHILELEEIVTSNDEARVILGCGARSKSLIELSATSVLFFRQWQECEGGGFDKEKFNSIKPIFRCLSANVITEFESGDSGTWLWSKESKTFVGMAFGIGFDQSEGKQCVFLPMEMVRKTAKVIIDAYIKEN